MMPLSNTKVDSGAVESILEADIRLTQHLRKTLQKGKMRGKKLISGRFYELLAIEAERRSVPLHRIWCGFYSASIIRREVFRKMLHLPHGGFHHEIYYFLLELFDGDIDRSSSVRYSRWRALIAGQACDDLQSKLFNLCHWIEAHAAYSAFVAYRTHKVTMHENPLRAGAMISACYSLSLPNSTMKGMQDRWRYELDWLANVNGREFVESAPEVDGSLTKAQAAPVNPLTPFERLLFCLWPLALHGRWVIADLEAFFIDEQVATDSGFSGDPKNFLACHGLRVQASAANRKVKAVALLPGLLPARSIVADWKRGTGVKSHHKLL